MNRSSIKSKAPILILSFILFLSVENIFCLSISDLTSSGGGFLSSVLSQKGAGVDSSTTSGSSSSGVSGLFSSVLSSANNYGTTGNSTEFLNSIVGNVKSYATSQLEWMQQLVPFANFVFLLPQNFIKSLMENEFSGRKFSIINKNTQDDQKSYGIEFDFGFDGSGDINQPFSFLIYNGRFYFRAVTAKFVPEKFYLKNADGSVKEATRTDIRQYPFSTVIPTILKQLFQEPGLQAWDFVKRFMSPYPEDVCILKLILLIASAYKNSKTGQGYPRIAHVPLELSVLFSKLAKTPNIVETQKLYPDGTKSNEWDPTKVVFLEGNPSKFIEKFPAALRDSLNQIQFPVYEGEQQEFKDMNGQGLTKAQTLYGKMRSETDYNKRTKMAVEKIIPFINSTETITQTDAQLLMYAIKIHTLERLDALNSYLLSKVSLLSGLTSTVSTAVDNIEAADLDLFKNSLSSLSGEQLRETMTVQYTLLKDLLTKSEASFPKRSVSSADISFISSQNQGLMGQIDRIVLAVDNLSKAIIETNDDNFKTAYRELVGEINGLSTLKGDVSKSTFTGQKINSPLTEYLKLKYFQFEQLNCKKFDGDTGYFKDDASMDTIQAVSYAMGVVLRAMKDLMKAQSLFNVDTVGQYMTNLQGEKELIRGKLIYQDYSEKPSFYLMTVQDNAASLAQKVSAQGGSAVQTATDLGIDSATQMTQINDKLKQANDYFNTLNNTYLHYVRQYKFDRRDQSGMTAGMPFDPSVLTKVVQSQSELAAADLEKKANDLIAQYKLTAGSPLVRLDLMIFKKKVETLLAPISDNSYTLKQEATLTDKNALVLKYTDDLAKLNTLKSDLDAKMLVASATAAPTPSESATPSTDPTQPATQTIAPITQSTEQIALKTQLDSVAVALKKRNDDLAAVQKEITDIKNLISSASTQVTAYKEIIAELDTSINNFDLKADNFDAALASLPKSNAAKASISKTAITDKDFLQLAIKVRELIISGKTVQAAAKSTVSTEEIAFLTAVKNVFMALEKGLSISAQDSLVGQKLEDAKIKADGILSKLISEEIDFRAFELEFLKAMSPLAAPADLKGEYGFCASVARMCAFIMLSIYQSSLGVDSEKFLLDFAAKLNAKPEPAAVTTTQNTTPSGDSVDALITQMSTPTTTSSSTSAMPVDEDFMAKMEDFISVLSQSITSDGVWQTALWENDILIKPEMLPISEAERMDSFWSIVKNIIFTKKDDLNLAPDVYSRIHAACLWLSDLLGTLYSDPANLASKVETWAKKLVSSTSQDKQAQIKALNELKDCWKWLGLALPYLIAYYKYVKEAGIKTSINDFLSKEFANLVVRSSSFSETANLYLDPILIKSFGVDTKTLIQSSASEQKALMQQSIAAYSSQIQNIESSSTNMFSSLSTSLVGSVAKSLTSLSSEPLTALSGTNYDFKAVEGEIAQKAAAAISSGDLQSMFNSSDFDAYFDKLSTDGVKFVEQQLSDATSEVATDSTSSDLTSATSGITANSTISSLSSAATGIKTGDYSGAISTVSGLTGVQPVVQTQELQSDLIPASDGFQ